MPTRTAIERQREAIEAFAKRAGYELVAEFYDQAVSGADEVQTRPGFAAMLERIATNGVRTIIVETANRFARDLIVQETGHRMLKDKGIEIIAADSPNAFVDDTPTTTFVRQVLGAVAQLDKAMTVAKLRGARERKRREAGWCEGGAAAACALPRGREARQAPAPCQSCDAQADEPPQDQHRAQGRRPCQHRQVSRQQGATSVQLRDHQGHGRGADAGLDLPELFHSR